MAAVVAEQMTNLKIYGIKTNTGMPRTFANRKNTETVHSKQKYVISKLKAARASHQV